MSQPTERIPHEDLTLKSLERSYTVYEVEGACGTTVCHDIMPGVQLRFDRFTTAELLPLPCDAQPCLEIDHCQRGRRECAFTDGACSFLREGDLIVSLSSRRVRRERFPLGFYQGITIMLTMPEGVEALSPFMNDCQLTADGLCKKLNLDRNRFYLPSPPEVRRIFEEIEHENGALLRYYYRLKILELLLFLAACPPRSALQEPQYYAEETIRIVHAVQKQLTAHYWEHATTEQLARQYGISASLLKKCFRDAFGKPIYTYLRNHRIQVACDLLQSTNTPVALVGAQVGYESSGKFIAAFRAIKGCTPLQFRRNGPTS